MQSPSTQLLDNTANTVVLCLVVGALVLTVGSIISYKVASTINTTREPEQRIKLVDIMVPLSTIPTIVTIVIMLLCSGNINKDTLVTVLEEKYGITDVTFHHGGVSQFFPVSYSDPSEGNATIHGVKDGEPVDIIVVRAPDDTFDVMQVETEKITP